MTAKRRDEFSDTCVVRVWVAESWLQSTRVLLRSEVRVFNLHKTIIFVDGFS